MQSAGTGIFLAPVIAAPGAGDSALRCWGALGILMRGRGGVADADKQLQAARADR